MAASLIQSKTGFLDSTTTSQTVTFDNPAVSGNMLILFCSADKGPGTFTVTSSGWTVLQTDAGTAQGNGGVLAYKVAAGGETAVAVSWSASGTSRPTMAILEYSGLSTPISSNKANSGDTAVTSIAVGSITTPSGNSFVLACAANDSVSTLGTTSWSDSFTQSVSGGSGGTPRVSIASRAFTSATTVNPVWTFDTNPGDQAMGMIAVFPEGTPPAAATAGDEDGMIILQSAKALGDDSFTGSMDISLPSLTQINNLLFLVVGADKNPVSVTLPSGFTAIQTNISGGNAGGVIAYKVSTGSEQSFTVGFGSSTVSKPTLFLFECAGFLSASPLDVSSQTNSGATNVSSAAAGQITLTAASSTVFAVSVADSPPSGWVGTRTWSDGFSEVAAGGRGSSATVSIAKKSFSSTGTVDTTFSWTADAGAEGSDQLATFLVAFKHNGNTYSEPTPSYNGATEVQSFAGPRQAAATSSAIKLPLMPKSGNLLVVSLSTNATPGTITPPAGFTIIKSITTDPNIGGCMAYKISDGTEQVLTFSWVNSASSALSVLEYGGVHATPLGGYNSSVTASATSLTSGPIITTTDHGVIVTSLLGDGGGTGRLSAHSWTNFFATTSVGYDTSSSFANVITASASSFAEDQNVSTTYSYTGGSAQPMATITAEFASDIGSTPTATDYSSAGKVATPTFSPTAGVYADEQIVTISTTTSSPTIYYTLDGSTPTTASSVYSTALTVSTSTTIKAFATASGLLDSDVATGVFTIGEVAPIILVGSNTAHSSDNTVNELTVSLPTPAVAGNLILLALGIDKNPGTVTLPSGFTTEQFYIEASVSGYILWKIAAGGEQSFLVSWDNVGGNLPTFAAYEYSGLGSVNVSTKNTSSNVVAATLGTGTITTTANCRAFAISMIDTFTNGNSSRSWSNGYTELTWAGFIGNVGLSVATKDVPAGATSSTYTYGPTADQIITFLVAFEGGTGITLETVATPTFSPTAGTYSSAQNVSISCSTPSSTIYYTTDGSTPTTGSSVYSTPITVSSSTTIKAFAVASGMADSDVATAAYVISAGGSVTQVRYVKALASAAITGTVTATFGSACTAGNLILLAASLDKAQGSYTITNAADAPLGFTVIQDHLNDAEGNGVIAWKISDGTETSFKVTATPSGGTNATPVVIVAEYSGTHATTPIGVSAEAHLASGTTGASFDCGTITTSTDNAYVVAVAYADTARNTAGEWSAASFSNSFTKVDDTNANNTPPGIAALAYGYKAAQPASTSVTTTYGSLTTAEGGGGFIVEIIPSGESGGGTTGGAELIQSKINFNTSSSTSVSVTLDQAPVPGNVLLVWCAVDKDYSGLTVPTGFTAIETETTSATSLGGYAAYKVAVGTESIIEATWTNGGTASRGSIIVHEYSGLDTVFVSGKTATDETEATSLATATITTPGTHATVFAFSAMDSVNASATSWITNRVWSNGYTEASFTPQTATNDAYPALSVAKKTVTASESASSTFSWTTGTDQLFTIIFAVESEAPSGPTKVATPTFSPAAGNYGATQNVTISCSTPSSTIYYTLDGSTPTTASSVYSTPLVIAATTTVKAFATATDLTDSNVATANFNIGEGTPNVSVSWQVAGAVTSTGGTVLLGISASASMLLKIYEMPSNTLVQTTASVATNTYGSHHVARIVVTGLNPNTQYKYLPNDTVGDILAAEGYLHTFPDGPGSFKFCHWSCSNTVNNARFVTIKNKAPLTGPLIGLNIGDLHYLDTNSTTESNYYQAMVDSYSSANGKEMYKVIAYDRVWDDHDFSGNDSNYSSAGKAASAAAFRKFTPHYPLPAETGHSVFHSFVCGRMRFIIMDTRSEKRSGIEHVSAQQLEFAKSEILAAKLAGQVVCIASPGAWIGSGNNDADLWPGSTESRAQRDSLATWIRQMQMNRSVFLISGDAHMLAADDGTNNTYGFGGGVNFRVFHGAGLSQNGSYKGGPYTYDGTTSNYRPNSSSGDANGQHGTVTVTDNGGSTITINWVGSYGATDTVWRDYTFTLDVPKTAKSRVLLV